MAFLDYAGLSRFKSKLDALFTKGPSSSTSNGVAIFDGTGGKTLKDSGFTIGKSVPSDAKFTDTTYSAATTSANGLMSSGDKTKLNGIATGAEVNQNAFSNVVVGSTTVSADSKTDTLTLVAGSNVTLTPDATNDKITIAATDTNTWRPVSDSVSSTSSSDAASSKAVKTAYDLANGKVSCTTANVKTALGTGLGATKFFREDGTWDVPPGARPYVVALDAVTNTSGSYTHTTSVANIRDDMKPIQLECSNPDAFQDKVSISTGNGSITLTCANVVGTSSVTVTVMESASAEQGIPGQVTSSEFNTLASRIGTLSSLTTANKSDLVSAANELNSKIDNIESPISISGTGATLYNACSSAMGDFNTIHSFSSMENGKSYNVKMTWTNNDYYSGVLTKYSNTLIYFLFCNSSNIYVLNYNFSTYTVVSLKTVSLTNV